MNFFDCILKSKSKASHPAFLAVAAEFGALYHAPPSDIEIR